MEDRSKGKPPAAIVLPFGKHKGATVAELLTKDPAYAEWIVNQGWVAERFAELHAAILSRGAATDDSPEHNAIQARFLDETFRLACLRAARPKSLSKMATTYLDHERSGIEWRIGVSNEEIGKLRQRMTDASERNGGYWASEATRCEKETAKYTAEIASDQAKLDRASAAIVRIASQAKFEQRGIDVVINASFSLERCEYVEPGRWDSGRDLNPPPIAIEIKPTMGDDFPSVMRQMERLGAGVLVLGEYTGRAVSEPQLRQMFAANGRTLLFLRDIEAEIANARAELAP